MVVGQKIDIHIVFSLASIAIPVLPAAHVGRVFGASGSAWIFIAHRIRFAVNVPKYGLAAVIDVIALRARRTVDQRI